MVELKNPFSVDEIQRIFAEYGLGQVKTKQLRILTGGIENTTLLVQTNKGNFVLRRWENQGISETKAEIEIMNFLGSKSTEHKELEAVPKVFANKKGQKMGLHEGKPVAVMEFKKGTQGGPADKLNDRQLVNVARLLGIMHKVLKDFNPEIQRSNRKVSITAIGKKLKKRTPYLLENITELSEKERQRISELAQREYELLRHEFRKIDFENLTQSILHNDLGSQNLKFKGNKVSGIFDFSDWFRGEVLTELAHVIITQAKTSKGTISQKKMERILDVYCQQHALPEKEKQLAMLFARRRELQKMLTAVSLHQGSDKKTRIRLARRIQRHTRSIRGHYK